MDEIKTNAVNEAQLPVDKERLQTFNQILLKYKSGKKRLEERVVRAENWWILRNEMETKKQGVSVGDGFKAKSGWLHNVIVSKHADAMESYPEPLVLPREKGDKEMAHNLSAVIPVLLEQNKFEGTYSNGWWQKLKTGTAVYKVWWDSEKHNGLGDVDIRRISLLNVFWEPGVDDIQDSQYFFHAELRDNEQLEREFPQLKDKLKGNSIFLTKFFTDDTISTDGKSLVIDVYYKIKDGSRKVLHYCQYVNNEVLASTENDAVGSTMPEDIVTTEEAEIFTQDTGTPDAPLSLPGNEAPVQQTAPPDPSSVWGGTAPAPAMNPLGPVEPEHFGLYDHGLYPFIFDPLWPVEGSPCGYGYVDLCANDQIFIDLLRTAFGKNALVGATPRYFQRIDGAVNEEEFLDLTKPLVHVNGNLGEDSLRQIGYYGLPGAYLNVLESVITELRETSGNTESANGIYSSGVTAASSIAALQEASGKTSRDSSRASYRAFGEMVDMIIGLIRQFYTLPRTFRITGEDGQETFMDIDNTGMLLQPLGVGSEDLGFRLPVFDVKVEVQKRNAYTRTSQNELAMQLFNLGIFNPQYATPALQLLDMMDFEGRDDLMQKIQQNGTLFQQVQQMQQLLLAMTQKYEPNNVANVAQSFGMAVAGGTGGPVQLGQGTNTGENKIVSKARDRANQAASPEV